MTILKLKKGFKRAPNGLIYDLDSLKATIKCQMILQKLPFNGFIEGNPTFPEQSKECRLAYDELRAGRISRNDLESNAFVKEYREQIATYEGVHRQYQKYLDDINFIDSVTLTMYHCAVAFLSGKQHLKVCAVQPFFYHKTKTINNFLKKKLKFIMDEHLCQRVFYNYRKREVKCANDIEHTCTVSCFSKNKCEECSKYIKLTRGGVCAVKLTLSDNEEIAKDILKKFQINELDFDKAFDDHRSSNVLLV